MKNWIKHYDRYINPAAVQEVEFVDIDDHITAKIVLIDGHWYETSDQEDIKRLKALLGLA